MKEKATVQKCAWTPEEDVILTELVQLHGPKKWSVIAGALDGRIGKQCRERWHNHLNPAVRKDKWSDEEDALIISLVEKLGTKWATIAKHMPGRTDNSIKNHYYSSLRKKHETIRSLDPSSTIPVIPRRRKLTQVAVEPESTTSSTPSSPPAQKRRRISVSSSTTENVEIDVTTMPHSVVPCSVSDSDSDIVIEEVDLTRGVYLVEESPRSSRAMSESSMIPTFVYLQHIDGSWQQKELSSDNESLLNMGWSLSDLPLDDTFECSNVNVCDLRDDRLCCPLQPLSIVSEYHSLLTFM